MTDFTTRHGATVRRPVRIQPERCAQCHCEIVGGRKRKYCEASCRQEARADRVRNHVPTAKEIKYKRDYQLAYRQTIPGIRARMRSQRKGRLNGTGGYRTREIYLAATHRNYLRRRKQQLAYAHERHARLSVRSDPGYCATCGVEVPYSGYGRPRKRCPAHHLGRGVRR